MLIYGLMKYIERIPMRYDSMMNALTFGGHSRAHRMLLSAVRPGMRVLDIGCGTGKFAMTCAAAGANVTAVDASVEMLRVFRNKLSGKPFEGSVRIVECGSASIGERLKDERFDLIVMSMMLGELPDIVRRKTIVSAAGLLSEDGKIMISDELWPENAILSLAYHFMFWVFFIPNFILTRTLIRPVKGLMRDMDDAGLAVTGKKKLMGGVISVITAGKRR